MTTVTIPTPYLWILAPLAAIGALHTAFALEALALTVLRALAKGVRQW